jgi:hypothetical protein
LSSGGFGWRFAGCLTTIYMSKSGIAARIHNYEVTDEDRNDSRRNDRRHGRCIRDWFFSRGE